ncbi:LysR substrate-binding domain-containing protein [Sulfitobacter sp. F26204]|uniref:LysR substrate-binding domain-containing protein n=1 Tax=Sulfitobacter sp. F26204 TaxID=2996014 RepID=UPI00225DFE6E|nr:LysR substrate-binding domain-containing protein [Sulfitobacter sp. F26204]MCX7561205.1 LysR substrate-binding domain-containing protein [Sulfitobacter sp. F26204]
MRSIIPEIRSVAHQLEHIGYLVGSQGRKKELCIGMPPALASIVLLRRLGDFQASFPQLNIRIRAANQFQNLEQERIDVTMRLLPRPADARAQVETDFFTPVANERMRLVCAPDYLASISENGSIQEHRELLSRAQLIHEDETQHFARYLSTFWRDQVLEERSVLTLNNADLILQTAIAGRGFALVREVYVMDALRENLLVEPFPHRLDCERVFHFVAPEAVGLVPSARAFVIWFGDELRNMMHEPTTQRAE